MTTDDEKASERMHKEIVQLEATMFEELGLHFRFDGVCTVEILFEHIFLGYLICHRKNLDFLLTENMISKPGCQRRSSTVKYVYINYLVRLQQKNLTCFQDK